MLPFENLGDSADAYFADGITDEVRGKLTAHPGPAGDRVATARRSTAAPPRRPQEIARELGVDYLLTGTVRWEKGAGRREPGAGEPRADRGGHAPTRKWQQPFDASLTDVFQVQADIAGQVAQALDVAIGSRRSRSWRTGRPGTWRPTTPT